MVHDLHFMPLSSCSVRSVVLNWKDCKDSVEVLGEVVDECVWCNSIN